MPDLTEFGAVSKPAVARHRGPRDDAEDVWLGDKHVGWYGRDVERDFKCFVSERDPQDHAYLFKAEDDPDEYTKGYGVSKTLLDKFELIGIDRIYIVEPHDVIDYPLSAFMGELSITRKWEDIQRIVPVEEAMDVWVDHASEFWTDAPPRASHGVSNDGR